MEKKKKISFKLPETIKHKEARKIISDLVKQLNDRGQLEIADIPSCIGWPQLMMLIWNALKSWRRME